MNSTISADATSTNAMSSRRRRSWSSERITTRSYAAVAPCGTVRPSTLGEGRQVLSGCCLDAPLLPPYGDGLEAPSAARSRGLRDRLFFRSVRAARRRRHPRPERGGEDRPRARQVPARRPLRGDRGRRRLHRRHRRRGPRPRRRTRHPPRGPRRRRCRDPRRLARRHRARPAVPRPPLRRRPARPVRARRRPRRRCSRRKADYVQGSRWMAGGHVQGATGGRSIGTRIYSAAFSVLALRRVSDATNGFRIFRAVDPVRSQDRHPPALARQLRPRAVRAVQGHPPRLQGDRVPRAPSSTTPRRATRTCAACATGGGSSGPPSCSDSGSSDDDPGALLRRATDPRHRRGRLRRRRRRQAARRRRRQGHRARRPVHRPGRDDPVGRPVRPGLGHGREARQRARRGQLARLPPRRPQHHREHEEPARRLRHEHRRAR